MKKYSEVKKTVNEAGNLKPEQEIIVNTGGKDTKGIIKDGGIHGYKWVQSKSKDVLYRVEFENGTTQYIPATSIKESAEKNVGDKVKYKSPKTGRVRTAEIVVILDKTKGKYELDTGAIVYSSDLDEANTSSDEEEMVKMYGKGTVYSGYNEFKQGIAIKSGGKYKSDKSKDKEFFRLRGEDIGVWDEDLGSGIILESITGEGDDDMKSRYGSGTVYDTYKSFRQGLKYVIDGKPTTEEDGDATYYKNDKDAKIGIWDNDLGAGIIFESKIVEASNDDMKFAKLKVGSEYVSLMGAEPLIVKCVDIDENDFKAKFEFVKDLDGRKMKGDFKLSIKQISEYIKNMTYLNEKQQILNEKGDKVKFKKGDKVKFYSQLGNKNNNGVIMNQHTHNNGDIAYGVKVGSNEMVVMQDRLELDTSEGYKNVLGGDKSSINLPTFESYLKNTDKFQQTVVKNDGDVDFKEGAPVEIIKGDKKGNMGTINKVSIKGDRFMVDMKDDKDIMIGSEWFKADDLKKISISTIKESKKNIKEAKDSDSDKIIDDFLDEKNNLSRAIKNMSINSKTEKILDKIHDLAASKGHLTEQGVYDILTQDELKVLGIKGIKEASNNKKISYKDAFTSYKDATLALTEVTQTNFEDYLLRLKYSLGKGTIDANQFIELTDKLKVLGIKGIKEADINEGVWSKIMTGVRKDRQPPFSVVAIENNKVVGQETDIRIEDLIPAHYEKLKREFPNAKISIENGEGKRVFNESEVTDEAIDLVHVYTDNTHKKVYGTGEINKADPKTGKTEKTEGGIRYKYVSWDGSTGGWFPEDRIKITEGKSDTPVAMLNRIIKSHKSFNWLRNVLPSDFTFDDLKDALSDAGYASAYDDNIKITEGKTDLYTWFDQLSRNKKTQITGVKYKTGNMESDEQEAESIWYSMSDSDKDKWYKKFKDTVNEAKGDLAQWFAKLPREIKIKITGAKFNAKDEFKNEYDASEIWYNMSDNNKDMWYKKFKDTVNEGSSEYNTIDKVTKILKFAPSKKVVKDFIKNNYDLNNEKDADMVADIIGYYNFDSEHFFDKNGNLLENIIDEADSTQKHEYMLLGRLQADAEYFLGNGNKNTNRLYYGNVKDHIKGMKKIWNELKEKPNWISLKDIEGYEKEMLKESTNEDHLLGRDERIDYIIDNQMKAMVDREYDELELDDMADDEIEILYKSIEERISEIDAELADTIQVSENRMVQAAYILEAQENPLHSDMEEFPLYISELAAMKPEQMDKLYKKILKKDYPNLAI